MNSLQLFFRVLLFGTILLLFVHYSGFFDTSPLAKEPTCFSLTKRDRYCIYENVCVNQRYGVFVLGRKPLSPIPMINMKAADEEADEWVIPPFVSPPYAFQGGEPLWINRTLLYGHGFSLQHLTHRLVNGLLPAIDLHRHINLEHPGSVLPDFDLILKHDKPDNLVEPLRWGFEEVFLGNPRDFHLLKGHHSVCYPRAILGLNNTCPFGSNLEYCDHGHEKELYDHVREMVWAQCQLTVSSLAPQVNERPKILVIQRERTRKMLQLERLVRVSEKYGEVQVLELEGMSFCEQARVFYDADVVVAVHGNAMGHLLWMRENAVIIELKALGFESFFFQNLLNGTKFKMGYHSLKCKNPSCAVQKELNERLPARDRSLVMDDRMLNLLDPLLSDVIKKF